MRDIVKIAKSKVLKQIVDLRDTWLERFTSGKGIEKLRGNRKITVKTYRELHKSYCEIYDPVSYGSFINCKPFYVRPPNETEMLISHLVTFLYA